jgi:hypothetical protein
MSYCKTQAMRDIVGRHLQQSIIIAIIYIITIIVYYYNSIFIRVFKTRIKIRIFSIKKKMLR